MSVGVSDRRAHQVRHVRPDRTGLDLLHRLLEDTQALSHLLDSHAIAVVAIPGLAYGYFELEAVVNGVGVGSADIPLDAAAAEGRACNRAIDCCFFGKDADTLGAGKQYFIFF